MGESDLASPFSLPSPLSFPPPFLIQSPSLVSSHKDSSPSEPQTGPAPASFLASFWGSGVTDMGAALSPVPPAPATATALVTFLHSPSLPSSHSSWSLTWRHSPSLPSSHRPSLARASAASLAACSAMDRADRKVSAESPPLDPDAWLPPPSPSRSSPSLVLRPASHPSPKASPKASSSSLRCRGPSSPEGRRASSPKASPNASSRALRCGSGGAPTSPAAALALPPPDLAGMVSSDMGGGRRAAEGLLLLLCPAPPPLGGLLPCCCLPFLLLSLRLCSLLCSAAVGVTTALPSRGAARSVALARGLLPPPLRRNSARMSTPSSASASRLRSAVEVRGRVLGPERPGGAGGGAGEEGAAGTSG